MSYRELAVENPPHCSHVCSQPKGGARVRRVRRSLWTLTKPLSLIRIVVVMEVICSPHTILLLWYMAWTQRIMWGHGQIGNLTPRQPLPQCHKEAQTRGPSYPPPRPFHPPPPLPHPHPYKTWALLFTALAGPPLLPAPPPPPAPPSPTVSGAPLCPPPPLEPAPRAHWLPAPPHQQQQLQQQHCHQWQLQPQKPRQSLSSQAWACPCHCTP